MSQCPTTKTQTLSPNLFKNTCIIIQATSLLHPIPIPILTLFGIILPHAKFDKVDIRFGDNFKQKIIPLWRLLSNIKVESGEK